MKRLILMTACFVPMIGLTACGGGAGLVTQTDQERRIEDVEIVGATSSAEESTYKGELANCVFADQSCATVPNSSLAREECRSDGGTFKPGEECVQARIIKYTEPEVIYR